MTNNMMNYLKFIAVLLQAGLLACSPSTQDQAVSCTASVGDLSKVEYEAADPYTLAIINVSNSADGYNENISSCNASVSLKPSSAGLRAQITTAKHCINPWTFRGLKMQLAGQQGYIDVDVRSNYLDKLRTFSLAVAGRLSSLPSDPTIDYSRNFSPLVSWNSFNQKDLIKLYGSEENVPMSSKAFSGILSEEKLNNNNQSLCEVGVPAGVEYNRGNPYYFNKKACFSFFDMISFDADLIVNQTIFPSLSKAASSGKAAGDENYILSLTSKITSLEFELFTLQLAQESQKCSVSSSCTAGVDSFKNLLSNNAFFGGNLVVSQQISTYDEAKLETIFSRTNDELFKTYNLYLEFVSGNIKGSENMRFVNNVAPQGSDRYLPVKLPFNRLIFDEAFNKPYGFIAELKSDSLAFTKGDSGSFITFKGIPIGVLSTYMGEAISSGVSKVIPSAKEEIVIPTNNPENIVQNENQFIPEEIAVESPKETVPVADSEQSKENAPTTSQVETEPGSQVQGDSFYGIRSDVESSELSYGGCI